MSQLSGLGAILPLLLASNTGVPDRSDSNNSLASALLGTGSGVGSSDALSLLAGLGGIPKGHRRHGGFGAQGLGSLLGSGLGGGNNQIIMVLVILALLKQQENPPTPKLYSSFGVSLEDANKVVDAAAKGNADGASKADLDAYIKSNASNTLEGKVARFFRGVFDLVAFQKGGISRLGKDDLPPFAKLDGVNDQFITATEVAGDIVSAEDADKIKQYIAANQATLNEMGDSKMCKYTVDSRPVLTEVGGVKLVLVGPNGDKGLYDPIAYFITQHRDWKTLTK